MCMFTFNRSLLYSLQLMVLDHSFSSCNFLDTIGHFIIFERVLISNIIIITYSVCARHTYFLNVISAIQIYDFHTFTVIYAPYSHNACYNKAIRIPVRMVWKNLIGCTRLTLSKISNHHSSKTIKVHILQ